MDELWQGRHEARVQTEIGYKEEDNYISALSHNFNRGEFSDPSPVPLESVYEGLFQDINSDIAEYMAQAVYDTLIPNPVIYCQPVWACHLPLFIERVFKASGLPSSTFFSTLVYLFRLKQRLKPRFWNAPHGVFVAALIVTSKYIHDDSPPCRSWVAWSGFSLKNINSMEQSFLRSLEWKLSITPQDLCRIFEPFVSPLTQVDPALCGPQPILYSKTYELVPSVPTEWPGSFREVSWNYVAKCGYFQYYPNGHRVTGIPSGYYNTVPLF